MERENNSGISREDMANRKNNSPSNPYHDILHLERPISQKRRRMTLQERAAQFAPFSALTGYEDCIEETIERVNAKWEYTSSLFGREDAADK